jgi:hypothetical protein
MTYDLIEQVASIIECRWREIDLECPYCHRETVSNDAWQPLYVHGDHLGRKLEYKEHQEAFHQLLELHWTQCLHSDCERLIVRATSYKREKDERGFPVRVEAESWLCVPPRGSPKPVDGRIPEEYRKDYQEAWAVLNDSPKMAATLGRRIAADLLDQYADCKQFNFAEQVDAFAKSGRHPKEITEPLDSIKELGDLGAHTKRHRETLAIVEATPKQAEWTLKVVERLFDYLILRPIEDREMIEGVEEMTKSLGRETGEERRARKAKQDNGRR